MIADNNHNSRKEITYFFTYFTLHILLVILANVLEEKTFTTINVV